MMLYIKMIKKDYFPTQETPEWVKSRVMSNVNRWWKSFRLIYLMKHRAMTTVSMLVLAILGSYLYLNNGVEVYINPESSNDEYTVNTTNIADTKSNIDNNDLLQKKINKAESDLDNLYDNLDRETNITF